MNKRNVMEFVAEFISVKFPGTFKDLNEIEFKDYKTQRDYTMFEAIVTKDGYDCHLLIFKNEDEAEICATDSVLDDLIRDGVPRRYQQDRFISPSDPSNSYNLRLIADEIVRNDGPESIFAGLYPYMQEEYYDGDYRIYY